MTHDKIMRKNLGWTSGVTGGWTGIMAVSYYYVTMRMEDHEFDGIVFPIFVVTTGILGALVLRQKILDQRNRQESLDSFLN